MEAVSFDGTLREMERIVPSVLNESFFALYVF